VRWRRRTLSLGEMLRRCVRLAVLLSLLATVIAALSRVRAARRPAPFSSTTWDRRPETRPAPQAQAAPAPRAAAATQAVAVPATPAAAPPAHAAAPPTQAAAPPAWVEAIDGAAPPTHPVKAKVSSGLYHLPGMVAYARTRPDRCYVDASAAEGDGFTRAKR
jgi:hypothetical protein